ncbi:hypothetical protein [Acinetobacter indicus]|uniref:hypothetical protein n=1 Tax=Acinetobacter indicus TaxID=756892 RepID=UPI003D6C7A4F
MGAVNHIAHDPATFIAAVCIELFLAVFTGTAAADSGNNHPVARFEIFDCRTDLFNNPDAFMAENTAIKLAGFFDCGAFNFRVFAFLDTKVGTANR